MKEKNEKKILDEDEISKLIKAFPNNYLKTSKLKVRKQEAGNCYKNMS